ncbi:hypothetical protein [Fredinandcohnia sp. 179-A 10B2 NHS]|uniref:hypothetical protein n=1 Tax=Fredinandcohnia sp. 179-A 10B2 NHS TaxID=3235176 RepID=UPI0039A16A95
MLLITFQFEFPFDLVSLLTVIVGWGVIVFFANRKYTKLEIKPSIWKVIVVLLFGLFTFSINVNMFETIIKIPILPLGAWILFAVLQGRGRWETYRSFAWLGFFSNFLFLALTLLTLGIQHVAYPPDHIETYISNVEGATIVNLHPSAKDTVLDKEKMNSQLSTMKIDMIYSDKWYEETYMNGDVNQRTERFPYQLLGVKGKWGSGVPTTIFIEDDGKGLLISTPQKQYYFRSKEEFVRGASE